MIILPDRNIARAKFLMPILYREWRPQLKTTVFQYWIAQAYRADHSMLWRGFFEDREDADAFMWALATGDIRYDRYLRQLPTYDHEFDLGMLDDPSISYNMVSMIGIGPSSGNWGVPGDCNGISGKPGEYIDCIAAGGAGGVGAGPLAKCTGGGGGGFARIYSVNLQPGGAYPYGVGSGGASVNFTGNVQYGSSINGNAGGHTYFWHGGLVYSQGGGGGLGNNGGANLPGGTAGGVFAGVTNYAGGAGGDTTGTYAATGGGGAAGPNGGGSPGQGGTSTGVKAGGNGNGNQIGQNAHGNWYGPWGPAGGGQGVSSPGSNATGAGPYHYGGGGGGAMGGYAGYVMSMTSGPGGGGLLVISYQPFTPVSVSSIVPTSGSTAGGTPVTISGAGFTSVSSVNIGGSPVTSIGVPNANTITGITSAGGAGTYNVNVNVSDLRPAGAGVNKYSFVTPPSLSSISAPVPAIGLTLGGMAVTLTGVNLTGVNSVSFGGTAATSVVVVNANTVTCVTPAHAPGLVNVVATNVYGSSTLANAFTYMLPASGFNMMPI
jgi:IPT/TIG domain